MTTNRPVALVTGASSGIGRAAARALAEAGFRGGRDKPEHRARSPLLDGVRFLDLDVASDASVARRGRAGDRAVREDRRPGQQRRSRRQRAPPRKVPSPRTQRVFDVNVFGVIRMTKAVLPHMRAQGSGRIINISSVLGFVPAPYMAIYAAAKHAIEGYSESVDHEVREHGVRVLLVEPAYTKTGFDANAMQADMPLPVYAQQRRIFGDVLAEAMKDGDDPAIVAKVIVAAATDPRPKLRYTAGPVAGRVSTLRRIVPARAFDRQIRKLNQLAG